MTTNFPEQPSSKERGKLRHLTDVKIILDAFMHVMYI